MVQSASEYRLNTTEPTADGLTVAESVRVAENVAEPPGVVLVSVTVGGWMVRTQSDGSELGSRLGYEQVLSSVPVPNTVMPASAAIAEMLQTMSVSCASNAPAALSVTVQ